jgi:hypothetical protein
MPCLRLPSLNEARSWRRKNFAKIAVLHLKEKTYGYRSDRKHLLLSSGAVSAVKDIPPKLASNAVFASFTRIKSLLKSLAGRIFVPAVQAGAFKKCCLKSGKFRWREPKLLFSAIDAAQGPARW